MVNKKKKRVRKSKSSSAIPRAEESMSMIESMAREDLSSFTKKRSLRDTVLLLRDQKRKLQVQEKVTHTVESVPLATNSPLMGYKLSKRVTQQLTVEEIKDLRMVFDFFDTDSSGSIDEKELRKAFKVLGFNVRRDEMKQMISEIDTDKSGNVEFGEFLEFVISRQGDTRDIYSEIMQGFNILDEDRDGFVTLDDLKRAVEEVDLDLTSQELKEMVQEADKNGDGAVDSEEFLNVMMKTNLFL